MKIALAQQNYHIGSFEWNKKKIIQAIETAKSQNADLIVFSELCICGYPPRDFLEFEDFINQCGQSVNEIAEYSDSIGIIVGTPVKNENKKGKDLFNAALLLYQKKVQQIVHKTLLPTYDIFDEYRYFEPGINNNLVYFKGVKIALTICEDIWNMGDNPLYVQTPMDVLAVQQPDFMINISASPYNYAQDVVRKSLVKAHTLKYKIPMFYCNTVGSQTEVVFDGGSLVYNAEGVLVKEMLYFKEDFSIFDTQEMQNMKSIEPASSEVYFSAKEVGRKKDILEHLTSPANISEIYKALLLGIKDYFEKMEFQKAILGASGGIDSAVTQALAVEALGKENVLAVLMPSPYSSLHSVRDAEALSKNLDNSYHLIAIKDIYEQFLETLDPVFKGLPFNVAEENIQARIRGNLLMGIANKFGRILLNTSNKSELATGYGTLYGDMAGGLSVLGDVYKTQVFALAKYINRGEEIIPASIIEKPPSAELRPNQKDSDNLPEYDVLDKILYLYIEMLNGPNEIIQKGEPAGLVKRVLKLVNTNEYKRNQFCPIIRVSYKAFGVGRRMPIVGKYLG